MVLGVAAPPERLAALAVEGERGGVEEDDGEFAEQVAAAGELFRDEHGEVVRLPISLRQRFRAS